MSADYPFTYDPGKNKANEEKHGYPLTHAYGVDFDAALIWEDVRRDYGESRFSMLAPIGDRLFFIAFTVRGDEELRLISLRKANRREEVAYEKQISTDQ